MGVCAAHVSLRFVSAFADKSQTTNFHFLSLRKTNRQILTVRTHSIVQGYFCHLSSLSPLAFPIVISPIAIAIDTESIKNPRPGTTYLEPEVRSSNFASPSSVYPKGMHRSAAQVMHRSAASPAWAGICCSWSPALHIVPTNDIECQHLMSCS